VENTSSRADRLGSTLLKKKKLSWFRLNKRRKRAEPA